MALSKITNESISALSASKLSGTIATARLGSGTASSSTFLRGDQTYAALVGSRVKVGTFTRDISLASGTQAITGVGGTPISLDFISTVAYAVGRASWGFDDGTVHECVFERSAAAVNTHGVTAGSSIFTMYDTSGNAYSGYASSLDSDGFTITWTKGGGTPTGTLTVYYKARF